jgi:hypothetical protein
MRSPKNMPMKVVSIQLLTNKRAWSSQDFQALYRASKKAVASCPTIVGPTTLEFPRPGQMSQIGMESKRLELEVGATTI